MPVRNTLYRVSNIIHAYSSTFCVCTSFSRIAVKPSSCDGAKQCMRYLTFPSFIVLNLFPCGLRATFLPPVMTCNQTPYAVKYFKEGKTNDIISCR